jgi:hypothetical protein
VLASFTSQNEDQYSTGAVSVRLRWSECRGQGHGAKKREISSLGKSVLNGHPSQNAAFFDVFGRRVQIEEVSFASNPFMCPYDRDYFLDTDCCSMVFSMSILPSGVEFALHEPETGRDH